MKRIEVVVNTCNRDDDLQRCLESLRRQSFQDFGIVVVDNGNSRVAGTYTDTIIKDPTKKLSYLFNLGWENTRSEIVAYIADDAEAEPLWLENILKAFAVFPRAGAVSGPVVSSCYPAGEMHRLYLLSQKNRWLQMMTRPYFSLVFENRILQPGRLCQSGAYTIGAGLPESKDIPAPLDIDLLTTTSMGIKRSALEEMGGLDENFWFNHADGDLFVRMKRKGYQLIFDPGVVVAHHVRLGPSRDPFFIGRDTGYFFAKDVRPRQLRGWVAFAINMLVLNFYWIYKMIAVKQLRQLKGISGFLEGIIDYLKYGKI